MTRLVGYRKEPEGSEMPWLRKLILGALLLPMMVAGLEHPADHPVEGAIGEVVACPVCGEEVAVRLILDADAAGGVAGDLAVHSSGEEQPWRYWIAYSPDCGYADWAGRFGEELTPVERDFIEDTFGGQENEGLRRGDIPLWERYRNLYLLESFRGAPDRELADILLIGWWCLRPVDSDPELRYEYLRLIITHLDAALRRDEIDESQLAERVYLAGELARLAGDEFEARSRLSDALTMPGSEDSDIRGFIRRSLLLTEAPLLRRRLLSGGDSISSHPEDAEKYAAAAAAWRFFENNPADALDRADTALTAYYYARRLVGEGDDDEIAAAELELWAERAAAEYALELANRPGLYAGEERDLLERLAAAEFIR